MQTHPRKSLRETQREETRRQLVQAGLRVVTNSGFSKATTAAVAEATGRAHGTVFAHFKTRDLLVAELVAEVGRTMSSRLVELDRAMPSISDVLDAHLQALSENEQLYCRVLSEVQSLPPAARGQVFALQSGVAWRLRLAYAREATNVPATVREVDPVMLANTWIGLTNHYVMNRDLFAPGQSAISKFGPSIKLHILNLLRS